MLLLASALEMPQNRCGYRQTCHSMGSHLSCTWNRVTKQKSTIVHLLELSLHGTPFSLVETGKHGARHKKQVQYMYSLWGRVAGCPIGGHGKGGSRGQPTRPGLKFEQPTTDSIASMGSPSSDEANKASIYLHRWLALGQNMLAYN